MEGMPMTTAGVTLKMPAMTPRVAFITRKPTAAATPETPSFSVNPSATPIAKISGRLPKITSPEAFMMSDTWPGMIPKWAEPMPSSSPATGRTATGSIRDLPTFWSDPNRLSFFRASI
jgi:hypothetical protein